MPKILILFLHGCLLELAMAKLDLILTSSYCGDYYDMEVIDEEAFVTYKGEWSFKKDCAVQFINYNTFSKQICIKPITFQIGCSTEVEYYRNYFSEYSVPTKKYTCRNASNDEWCGPTRTSRFYLLIRTAGSSISDYIRMRVYLKPNPDSDDVTSSDDTSSTGIVIGVIGAIFILIVFTVSLIACKVAQQRRRQAFPRLPYVYQTVEHTGQGDVTQTLTGNNPAQQAQTQPTVQGGYQFHPMQSAYPITQQTDIGHQSALDAQGRFPNPSAPPVANADPPPSYESVTK